MGTVQVESLGSLMTLALFHDLATLTATKSSLLNPVTLCNFPSLADDHGAFP